MRRFSSSQRQQANGAESRVDNGISLERGILVPAQSGRYGIAGPARPAAKFATGVERTAGLTLQTLDIRAAGRELLFDRLVAAIQVIDPVHHGLSLCRQPSQDE